MPLLHADSFGPLAGFTATGRVHSVFRRACNLLPDGGQLTALLHPGVPRTPWAFRLREEVDFQTLLAPGDRYSVQDQRLTVAGRDLAVDLRGACLWPAQLPAIPTLSDEERAALSRAICCALAEAGWPGMAFVLAPPEASATLGHGVDASLKTMQEEGVRALQAAIGHSNTAAAHAAILSLLGLGAGLTPSGDDFLVGVLIGQQLSPDEAPDFWQDFRMFLASAAPERTHGVSAAFLTASCAGLFSENVLHLLAAAGERDPGQGDPERLESAIHGVLSFGASSGADTLTGVVCGIEACSCSRVA